MCGTISSTSPVLTHPTFLRPNGLGDDLSGCGDDDLHLAGEENEAAEAVTWDLTAVWPVVAGGSVGVGAEAAAVLTSSQPHPCNSAALFLLPQCSGNASFARWTENKAFIGAFLSPEYSIDVLLLHVTSIFKAAGIRSHTSRYSHLQGQFIDLQVAGFSWWEQSLVGRE